MKLSTDKVRRLVHDAHTRASTLLGRSLKQTTPDKLASSATRSWKLQSSGQLQVANHLEHSLNPECPLDVELSWEEVRCWEIANARLTGDDCNVFLPTGEHLGGCPSLSRHPTRKIRRPLKLLAERIEEPCFYLAGRNFENHGHFLLHHLPRLAAALPSVDEMGSPRILLGSRSKRWQERYLAALGVPGDRLVRASAGTTIVNRLFYAPQMWTQTALAAPETLSLLRSAFLTHNRITPSQSGEQKPILISRADAPDRQLINEREIAAEVERQWGGCEILELSKLDFASQLTKFASAPLIVGALGQGFANLLVARGALCLILDTEVHWGESYFSQTFRDLALLNGNLATRLFAGRPIEKREHWSYPPAKFQQELSKATAVWKQHHQPTCTQ